VPEEVPDLAGHSAGHCLIVHTEADSGDTARRPGHRLAGGEHPVPHRTGRTTASHGFPDYLPPRNPASRNSPPDRSSWSGAHLGLYRSQQIPVRCRAFGPAWSREDGRAMGPGS
jgi:hypothetical protein